MISALIVWATVALAVIFTAAWVASPGLRAWIEQPKHRFLEAVQGYDRSAGPSGEAEESRLP